MPTTEKTKTKTYIHLAEYPGADAVIAKSDFVDQVEITAGDEHGESTCTVSWYAVGRPRPRVEVFDEDWAVFARAADVFAAMAEREGSAIQPAEFCRLLDALGYENVTLG